ncbi:group II intron maturase-specific domain-containing protein [Bacillus thuringiensis]
MGQYFRSANMKRCYERVDQKLRSRIRVIIWKQWKVPKNKSNRLFN